MRTARFGDPVRVAFAGRQALHGRHAQHAPAGGLLPRFFDVRDGDAAGLAAALDDWGAHVAIAFDLPAAALAGTRAATLGVVAEPLPRERGVPRADAAPRLDGFSRVAGVDAAVPGLWRAFALPVDDALYAPVRPAAQPPRALFVGASGEHRERFLIPSKHEYDVVHHAHGLHGPALAAAFARTDVAINLHHEPWPAFHSGVLAHLAAGHLVISEPLQPGHGLEAGIDFLEIRRPDQLLTALYQLQRRPDAHERVRLSGRAKAEAHRASLVWPRVVGDLLADLRAFPSARDPVR
jgi:hypothetical protein